jgi:hypothetical protein
MDDQRRNPKRARYEAFRSGLSLRPGELHVNMLLIPSHAVDVMSCHISLCVFMRVDALPGTALTMHR